MKLLIVIVLYKLKLKDSISFTSLSESLKNLNRTINCKFFIYDNSGGTVDDNEFKYGDIAEYISSNENVGISKAYNIGAKYASKHGFDWVLFSDQDTFFPKGVLTDYVTSAEQYTQIKLFCPKIKISRDNRFMSPVKKNHYFSNLQNYAPKGIINIKDYAIINSGTFVNVSAFFSVGGYNELVWLDFSDFQFFERFSQKYKQAYVIESECIQSFSDENPDIDQKIMRFRLFCSSVKHFEANLSSRLWIFFAVLKRTLSLCLQSRRLKPISVFINDYLR